MGLLRFNSFYARIHAPTLGTSLGMVGVALASMLYFSVSGRRLVIDEILILVMVDPHHARHPDAARPRCALSRPCRRQAGHTLPTRSELGLVNPGLTGKQTILRRWERSGDGRVERDTSADASSPRHIHLTGVSRDEFATYRWCEHKIGRAPRGERSLGSRSHDVDELGTRSGHPGRDRGGR